jgi:hypothetical protein
VSDGKHDARTDRGDDALLGEATEPHRDRARRPAAARRLAAGILARLTYTNVVATLALFVALGGTATAATLARDSVGSVQIKKDAVRSPEIQADAVRSPEIRADAVRSSEIRDESIRLDDIAPAARTALDAPRVRIAENSEVFAPPCTGPLVFCSNLLSVVLPPGNWLVQAKFGLRDNGSSQIGFPFCGLVQSDTTVLDGAHVEALDDRFRVGSSEVMVLSDVVTDVAADTRVALRCDTNPATDLLVVDDIKITALEVGPVTGP